MASSGKGGKRKLVRTQGFDTEEIARRGLRFDPKKHDVRCKRTDEVTNDILTKVEGGQTVTQACRDNGISLTTWYNWGYADKELRAAFEKARADGEQAILDDCMRIADGSEGDYDDDGKLNAEYVQRSKLRIETRLKLLAKWNPKRFGDSSQLRITDNDGNPLHAIMQQAAVNIAFKQPRVVGAPRAVDGDDDNE